jgi:hypothetical protein
VIEVVGLIGVVGLIEVLLPAADIDAAPGVARVRRTVVESRKKMCFMPLSYCGLRARAGLDRQTTV